MRLKPRPRVAGAARELVTEGVRRLVAYQDVAYARLYLDRLKPVTQADARANGNGKLLAETARHLAVRMSFEDVIRVAEAKIDPARFRRIEGEINAKDQPFVITEFLKPASRSCARCCRPACARDHRLFGQARLARYGVFRDGAEDHDVWGYLRFWASQAAPLSPKSWRFHEEQIAIEAWLARVVAARNSPAISQ